MKPTEAQMKIVSSLAYGVYQDIAADVCDLYEDGICPDDDMIEMIGDASRMEMAAQTDVEKEALKAFRQMPWKEQCQSLYKIL